jgi:hypothetical protein
MIASLGGEYFPVTAFDLLSSLAGCMLFNAAGQLRARNITTLTTHKAGARPTWRLATGPTSSTPQPVPQDEDILSRYGDRVYT